MTDWSWSGDGNPGHQRRLTLWREIEDEFGESVADVIQGLRQQDGGNSWRTVAGVLGVSDHTLQEWRHALGLPVNAHDHKYDPSSKPELTETDRKARALGYEDATDAVLDLRLLQGLTVREAGEVLGVHYQTICQYTPKETRGTYNRSARWWESRREQVKRMTSISVASRRQRVEPHPFSYGNDLLFRRKKDAFQGNQKSDMEIT